jgi:hypothetical protein
MDDITKKIFPITLACDDRGWSAYSFQKAFRAAKPEGLTWYGYDTIIHSSTDVEFVVYDMENNVHGGLGKKTGQFRATVPPSLTANDIDRKIVFLATERREAELRAAEQSIIAGYADEMRASLALSSKEHS